MNSTETRHSWEAFLRFYSRHYMGRKTRLAIFEEREGVANDLWVESGLPLIGMDIDLTGERHSMEVLLDGYSHSVANVRGLDAHFSHEGDEDGLDILHDDGKSTILRFEQT
jgi:hypothetical protein